MRGYLIFLKKELIESVKTYRLFILVTVFLIFGIVSPLLAVMTPEIMQWAMATDPSTAGIDLSALFGEPTALDSWAQFYSNVGQLGLIILVIVFSGMLSSEVSGGTLTIILTKGLSRSAAVLSKLTSAVLIWSGCLLISFFTAWGYTIFLFPGQALPNVFFSILPLWLFGVFLLSLTTLAAVIATKSTFTMLLVGGAVAVLHIINIIPIVGRYNPVSLMGSPMPLLSFAATPWSIYPGLIAASICVVAVTSFAVIKFSQKKTIKAPIILAIAVIFSLSVTMFFGEGIPAQIRINRVVISENVTIGEGTEWELAGVLTLPRDVDVGEKLPAVVLVHGSGAHDMNSAIFDNQPFREIAEYLSSNGVAVLRYNKRTYTHGLRIVQQADSGFSVWDETIEDALLATEILRSDPRIDEDRVFFLGHSLGGMLAPRIHTMGGDYAGLIIFAGSPRSLLDIMMNQQAWAAEAMQDEEERLYQLEFNKRFEEAVEMIISMSAEEAKDTFISELGTYAYYWKDLHENTADRFISEIDAPFLIMHPANDMHLCIEKDFGLYKELFEGRSNAVFKLYDGLNHLFMPSTITNITEVLDEYMRRSNIDPVVLQDILEWIKAN